ncbi:hypothetical protein CO659_23895 [Rhizobium sp. S9]|nr:hypothetical protein CO659_23895 [Rhizobium sp. S9]
MGVWSMQIEAADASFLKTQIEFGDVILILGAGASAGSRNAKGGNVKVGKQLAEVLARRASLPYDGESLKDVLDAVRGEYLSDQQILSIYSEEYSRTVPSLRGCLITRGNGCIHLILMILCKILIAGLLKYGVFTMVWLIRRLSLRQIDFCMSYISMAIY